MSANKRKYGYWKPFIEAVLAMQVHDTLIWDMEFSQKKTFYARMKELRSSEFKVFSNWFDGKMFVVRVL